MHLHKHNVTMRLPWVKTGDTCKVKTMKFILLQFRNCLICFLNNSQHESRLTKHKRLFKFFKIKIKLDLENTCTTTTTTKMFTNLKILILIKEMLFLVRKKVKNASNSVQKNVSI